MDEAEEIPPGNRLFRRSEIEGGAFRIDMPLRHQGLGHEEFFLSPGPLPADDSEQPRIPDPCRVRLRTDAVGTRLLLQGILHETQTLNDSSVRVVNLYRKNRKR